MRPIVDASISNSGSLSQPRWSIASGQRFVFEDFDDGIVMFDAVVGATHLLNVTAAETLILLQESPRLSTAELHARLLEKLEVSEEMLPLAAVEELAWRLEDLGLIAASSG
jgi:PqqD family protein of HPr-rel-A system